MKEKIRSIFHERFVSKNGMTNHDEKKHRKTKSLSYSATNTLITEYKSNLDSRKRTYFCK